MKTKYFILLIASVLTVSPLVLQAQNTITITSPLDQAYLDLYNLEFFNLTWTANFSAGAVEAWVDGQVYSQCGSGYSGNCSLDSWLNPPFQDRCWHVLQLRTYYLFGWTYSTPVIIYDSAYPGATPCFDPPCPTTVGGPIDVARGKMYVQQEDLRIDGPLPLIFSRRYIHKIRTTLATFGYGWRHSYDYSLATVTAGRVVTNPEGRTILFATSLAGGYDDNRRDHLSLAAITGGYRMTTKDQTQYTFNSAGRLTGITDRNGNTVTLAYDGSNRLSTVTDAFGRSFTLTYNGAGRVATLTDGTRTVTYGYTDGQNNLNTVTYPGSQTWTIYYGTTPANHRPATFTDPMSHVTESFAYNASDKVQTWSRQGSAEQLTFTYVSGTQTRVTNSLAVNTTFNFDSYTGMVTSVSGPGCSSCGSGTNESYILDAWFNKKQITDGNGNITKQDFDGYGNVLTKTEAFGTGLARITTFTYDPTYHYVATVVMPSVDTGGQNRVETYTYDPSTGDLLTENLSGYSNGSPFSHTTTYTYNSHALVLTIDGPRTDVSDVTTNTYYADNDGTVNNRARLHTITNAEGHVTAINSYTVSGKPTVTIDPNSVERDDCYDALDRFCGVTIKGATPADDLITTYSLNNDGLADSVTLPNGNVITYTRDALHRLTEITDAAGNKTVNTYNTESLKTREELRDASATVTKFTNYAYDTYNRLQYVYFNATVPPAVGSIYWAYTYDNSGNQTSVKDPMGHLVCHEYDALNRKTKTHQYLGTPPAACLGTCTAPGCVDLLTQFGYDTQDHLTTITDPRSLVTIYDIDDAAEIISLVSPDAGTATSTYDEAGNLHTRTDANSITETRTYDALNRLTSKTYPNTSNNVGYSYDSTETTFGLGKRTGMTDPAGATAFSYDFAGRLAEEIRTPSGQPNVFTLYGWDKNGNQTGITYPSGRSATFAINNCDQVTGATAIVNGASAAIASAIAYAPFGLHKAVPFGNGLTDNRTYDSRYRLSTWTLGGLINKTYTWQDDDNITAMTDNLNAANNRGFAYDAVHRLTTGNGPWGAGSYSYDGNGNRLTKVEGASSTNYSYYTGTNRLQTATGSEPGSYSYDSNGNTTGDGTHTYQYSQRDRMSTVDSGTTATYSVDGDGRRVKKVAGGITTLYFYDPEGRPLEEYIPASNTGKDYVWMPGTYEPLARVDFNLTDADIGDVLRCTKSSPNVHLDWSLFGGSGNFLVRSGAIGVFNAYSILNSPFSQKTLDDPVLADSNSHWYDVRNRTLTDTLYFYHADHLGTPLAMTNTAGALVWQAEEYPFGGIYALTVGTTSNSLRYPGQYYDSETGLAQNWNREYSKSIGQYMAPDPLKWAGFSLDPDPYEYANSNPIILIDFAGLCATDAECLACIVYSEAGGVKGPDTCKVAVAWTVKNRLGKPYMGDTSSICSIVKSKIPGTNRNAYNGYGNKKWNWCCGKKCPKIELPEISKIKKMMDNLPPDPTSGATSFNNAGLHSWASRHLTPVKVPGCGLFDFYK